MKTFKSFFILIGIINLSQLIFGDDLLELNCFNETECKQFQSDGIKSVCIEEQCLCTTDGGENVQCRPANSKVNNIIGSVCPCQQVNAECDKPQDICYCKSQFMPSRDRRYCIPKLVALDEKCEQDSQCQSLDFNAICHESAKQCKCMDNFLDNDGKCVSIVGKRSESRNESDCHTHYGNNTKYSKKYQQCFCVPDHSASSDNLRCVKNVEYLENCESNLQCIGTMGPGAECTENACQCSAKYFVQEKKTADGSAERVCSAIIERGHYCRHNEDCFQRQISETEQSMVCVYGECDCKEGFHSHDNSHCVKGSGAVNKSLTGLQLVIIISTFLFTS